MGWQDWFDQARADKVVSGDHEIYLYREGGVRFRNSEHCITLIGEFEDASGELGKKWLLFPNPRHVVFLPSIPCWDDGETIDESTFELILRRVSEALSNANQAMVYSKSNEVYEKARMDWLTYGQSLPSELNDEK